MPAKKPAKKRKRKVLKKKGRGMKFKKPLGTEKHGSGD